MKLVITIETGNAAFEGDDLGPEVARILQSLIKDIDDDRSSLTIVRDANGNAVGQMKWEEAINGHATDPHADCIAADANDGAHVCALCGWKLSEEERITANEEAN